jgi:2-polyprenyl-3-methyl-5-hydroxy-6-metoxy-1,4-benzoquinol methylase
LCRTLKDVIMSGIPERPDEDGKYRLVINRYGFYEASPKPSPRELAQYYAARYFCRGANIQGNAYSFAYTKDELAHKGMECAITASLARKNAGRLLDIGPGEGFFMDWFSRTGWDVQGVDFTDQGLTSYFPALSDRLILGDLYPALERAVARGERYDLVVLNGVLEHVLEPERLVRLIRELMAPDGVLRVMVPNDGSWLQKEAVAQGRARPDFWVCAPVHLSYFSRESLCALLTACGWQVNDVLGGFPIEIYLLNEDSCYTQDSGKGRNCHFARVAFENALYRRSPDDLLTFRRGCADAGLGRDIIVFASASPPVRF